MARILFIDDEPAIRMIVRLVLGQDRHTVEMAKDGHDGLLLFSERRDWDLVLLDDRMPGIDGLEVLSSIKRHDARARVVMLSAFESFDLTARALEAGAVDVLRKPFSAVGLR